MERCVSIHRKSGAYRLFDKTNVMFLLIRSRATRYCNNVAQQRTDEGNDRGNCHNCHNRSGMKHLNPCLNGYFAYSRIFILYFSTTTKTKTTPTTTKGATR